MANLRIVYDNAANRAATLVASTTAGTLAASNMLTDIKSEVWRSTSTSATITLTWNTAEVVSAVALPFCSLTSTATIRVRCYTNTADVTPATDSGTVLAAPSSLGSSTWGTMPLGVNAYSYGGSAYADVWLTPAAVKKVVIDLVDTSNALGYVEAAKIVVGQYWSPSVNTGYGAKVGVDETTRHERSDAGDLRTDRGASYKTLTFDLGLMPATDRNQMWNIIRGNGMYKPVFVSLCPESSDTMEEQIFQIYGKMTRASGLQYQFMNQFATSLQIEEI
jgi:hypothetical protein